MSHSDQTSLMDCVNGGVIIIVAIIIARQLVVIIRAIINQSFCIPWILHYFFLPFFFCIFRRASHGFGKSAVCKVTPGRLEIESPSERFC